MISKGCTCNVVVCVWADAASMKAIVIGMLVITPTVQAITDSMKDIKATL